MIMIKCSKHSEKKWNGLNPVIPKAEGHFEKDACFYRMLLAAKTATSQLGRMQ